MSLPPETAALTAPACPPEAPTALAPVLSPSRIVLRRGLRHTGFLIGAAILGLILVAVLAAPLIAPHDPYAQDVSRRLIPPVWQAKGSWDHVLGTDKLGRDYLSRLLYGGQISLLIGISAALISGLIGTTLGLCAGYFGGWVDSVVSYIVTTRLAMPVVLVALAMAALVGGSLKVVVLVLGFLLWDRFAVVTQNGNGIARGIYSGENTSLFTINNTGLISAARGSTATATTSAVAAIDSDDDTDRLVVNNAAAGRITASGSNSRALSGRAAQYEINNSGVISNTTAGEAAIATFALNAGNAGDGTTPRTYNTVITNTASGVINGDVRNTDQDLQTATTLVNLRRTGTLSNAGTINGNVAFGGGNQTVNNTGTITGGISFLDVAATTNVVNLGTGSVVGGAIAAQGLGTNTLNLTGLGTFTASVSGFTSFTQSGAGSAWTLGPNSVVAISGNLTVAAGTLTLAAGSQQSVGGLIQVTGSGAQLTNNTALAKTVNLSGSNTTLVNTGTITGTGAAGRANTSANRVYGVISNSTGADFANVAVVNTGTIAVTENGIGVSRGVYAGENIASMTVTNAGTISAVRAAGTTGTAAVAAVDSDDDVAALTVANQAGGRIAATGTNARAIQGRAQSYTITNAGTISATSGAQAIVVYGAGNAFLTNTGTISGDVRFTDADPQSATTANRRNSTTVNSGLIAGNLVYGMGNHTLTDTGQITGAISFADVTASRNSITLGTGATLGGPITATGRGTNALNRIDLALRLGDAEETGYRAAPIMNLWIGLYAAPAYLGDRPAPASLADLAAHDLILSRERPGAMGILLSDGRGQTEQIAVDPAVRASDFATVLRLTLAGAGIGYLPNAVAARAVEAGTLVRVLAPWATTGGALRALSLAGRELPARVRVFREHVRRELIKRFAVEPDQG